MRNGLIGLLLLLLAMPLQAARLVVLDVGEGQALFLQQGEEAMLIDTGHAGMAAHVLRRLRHYGVKSLRGIILTHLHPDHASGYFRIREAFPETTVLDNGQALPRDVAPDMVRWLAQALRDEPRRRVIRAGERIDWGEMRIEVLWPREFSNYDLNRHSLVLLVQLGETRLLIMGDAPQSVERRLMQLGLMPKQVDILVVGHHGASDSSDRDALRYLAPRISIISVNAHNLRGYPDVDTLKRLKTYSRSLYRTDEDGELCLRLTTRREQLGPCP